MRTVLTVILFLFTMPALARPAGPASDDRILSPYFFIDGKNPDVEAFPLKSTKVIANISGVIADVTVTQIYENQGKSPIHAKYVFPGSTRAAVHGMRIRVRDKAVVAKIKEREKAKQEFEEAKAAGKSASLLEQQRPNVFTMAVANILPGDRVEVELTYSEMLVPEEGIYEFVYPTVVGPRYSNMPEAGAAETDKWVQSPYLHQGKPTPATFSIRVNVSSGVPLADLKTPQHTTKVDWEQPSLAHVTLDNDAGNRDFILNYRLSGKEIQSGLMVYEGAKENFFLLTVQPPERIAAQEIPPREYIFVLDVSGSMYGFPLDTAKQVLKSLIGRLKPTDTFNVILFSGGSRLMAPQSVAANSQNVARAISVIEGQNGGGGTELEPALRRAIQLPRSNFESRSIVIVTDGFIAQERGVFTLIHDNLNTTNFFAFGIGSSVNRYLIEGIARAGHGEPFIVTHPDEAGVAGDRFRRYIETPVLTNVRVTYNGFDAYDIEPAAQPDLFAERPVVVFGKWRGDKGGQIAVTGRLPNGSFNKVFDVQNSASRPEHEALPQLWARNRIARLSDFNFDNRDEEAIREVTSLGLTYSLLTEYTSFIAVLEEVRNPDGNATDVDQPLPLPDGVSDFAVGYGSGSEPGFWILLLAAGTVAAIAIRRKAVSC
jgi:Ca-activated chloride channel family protein